MDFRKMELNVSREFTPLLPPPLRTELGTLEVWIKDEKNTFLKVTSVLFYGYCLYKCPRYCPVRYVLYMESQAVFSPQASFEFPLERSWCSKRTFSRAKALPVKWDWRVWGRER